MSRARKLNLCVLIVAACTAVAGCMAEKKSDKPAPAAAPNTDQAMPPAEPAGTPAADPLQPGAGAANSDITKALAQLLPEDRALAEKQKICPVSGEPLGSMGTPKKVNVGGHDVFICCPSCEQSLMDEPEKYLAKIGINVNEGPALK